MTALIGVLGASGRAGSRVLEALKEFPEFTLAAAVVAPDCPLVGKETGWSGVRYSSDIEDAAGRCDLVVDFSTPVSGLALARALAARGKPGVIGTTGFSDAEKSEIRNLSNKFPVLVSSNMSLGVFVLGELSRVAARLLGPEFQIEIGEIHHQHKVDAPSGTALLLAERIMSERTGSAWCARGAGTRGAHEIGISSLRGGDVVGEHTVFLFGKGERLELTHRATDRTIFARGALAFAKKLIGKSPGYYALTDLI